MKRFLTLFLGFGLLLGAFILVLTPQTVLAAEPTADLQKISIHFGTFSPEFRPEITDYTVTLDAIVEERVNINITPADLSAQVFINGKKYGGGESTINLPFTPIFSIQIIGRDGRSKTYRLNMERSLENATLTRLNRLEVKANYSSPALPLSQAFDPNITDYTVTLNKSPGERVIISLSPTDYNARTTVNGVVYGEGGWTASLPLESKMVIEVTGRDGSKNSYTLNFVGVNEQTETPTNIPALVPENTPVPVPENTPSEVPDPSITAETVETTEPVKSSSDSLALNIEAWLSFFKSLLQGLILP